MSGAAVTGGQTPQQLPTKLGFLGVLSEMSSPLQVKKLRKQNVS